MADPSQTTMTSANTENSFEPIDYEEMVKQRYEERQVKAKLRQVAVYTVLSFLNICLIIPQIKVWIKLKLWLEDLLK